MPRIKLPLPLVESVYHCQIPIRITDLNYGAHLGNQVILEYCHEARVQFFSKLDQKEKEFLGLGLIMSDSAIVYKSEAFWGDNLHVHLYVTEINSRGFELFYHFKTEENKEIARVKTGMVFFDYQTRRIQRTPAGLEELLLNCPT